MSKKQYLLLVGLVVVSGIIGGGLSNWFLMGDSAFAKKVAGELTPADYEKVVMAKELRLVDSEGRERITVGMNNKDKPRIVFWNPDNGKSSIILGLNDDDTPGLTFWDNEGKSRANIILNNNQDPQLRFIDKDGRSNCITMGISSKGEPGLALFDKSGKQRAKFSVTADEASLGFMDVSGNERVGLGMLTKAVKEAPETPVLFLRDNDEKSYWEWMLSK